MKHELAHIEAWIFDLDHTLYDNKGNRFLENTHNLFLDFAQRTCGMSKEQANEQWQLFDKEYGHGLEGWITQIQGFDVDAWHEEAEQLDLSDVQACGKIHNMLAELPGKKFVMSNAQQGHVERMLTHLDMHHYFDDVLFIEPLSLVHQKRYKPHPVMYEEIIKKHAINPQRAAFFEDKAINLEWPHANGMHTVHVHHGMPVEAPYICHSVPTLTEWAERYLT